MVFPQCVSVDCVPWRECKPGEDCLFASRGVERDLTTWHGQQQSEGSNTATCGSTQETLGCLQEVFDEGMRRMSGFGHWWRLFLIPEFLITGQHSTDMCKTDDEEVIFALPLSHLSFGNVDLTVCRRLQQVNLQLWLIQSPDLKKDLLHYLQYSQLMRFLFIIRFYIKPLILKC